jgi:hypothetical protein
MLHDFQMVERERSARRWVDETETGHIGASDQEIIVWHLLALRELLALAGHSLAQANIGDARLHFAH